MNRQEEAENRKRAACQRWNYPEAKREKRSYDHVWDSPVSGPDEVLGAGLADVRRREDRGNFDRARRSVWVVTVIHAGEVLAGGGPSYETRVYSTKDMADTIARDMKEGMIMHFVNIMPEEFVHCGRASGVYGRDPAGCHSEVFFNNDTDYIGPRTYHEAIRGICNAALMCETLGPHCVGTALPADAQRSAKLCLGKVAQLLYVLTNEQLDSVFGYIARNFCRDLVTIDVKEGSVWG